MLAGLAFGFWNYTDELAKGWKEEKCFKLHVFFNDTATTEIYTLSLLDALPIFIELIEAFARVVSRVRRRVGRAHAKCAVSRSDRELRAFLDAHAGLDAGYDARSVV